MIAPLTHFRTTTVVRGEARRVNVTEGPDAETAEQRSGSYGVETRDLDGLPSSSRCATTDDRQ